MTRQQTNPTKTKIGENEVEESKMDHVVPNQELSTDGYTLMSEAEISEKLDNIVYKPKNKKP